MNDEFTRKLNNLMGGCFYLLSNLIELTIINVFVLIRQYS
jgi:hypothetical protein